MSTTSAQHSVLVLDYARLIESLRPLPVRAFFPINELTRATLHIEVDDSQVELHRTQPQR
jgi:hypothetical protein